MNMKKFLFAAAALAVLAGCQKTAVPEAVPGLVRLSPVITRATDVDFENGDKIGLSIVRNYAETDDTYAENQLLTYSEGVFSGSVEWYAEALVTSTLTAYCPYDSKGVPSTFTVSSDQTAGLSSSDFIAGVKTGVTPSVNSIVMPFKHLLTKITLNIDNQSGADISGVELRGSKTTAAIDSEKMTAEASEESATETVKTHEVTANKLFNAIVVPQTVAFELAVTTSSGAELTQTLVSSELKQGSNYTVNVKVLPAEIKVTLSGDIENWNDGGEIGQDTPSYVDFEEYEGYFIYKNQKYTTVTLSDGTTWMSQPMRYVPDGYTVSTDPAATDAHIWAPYTIADGVCTPSTEASLVESNGYLYDFEAIFGKDITVDNAASFEGKQGICPDGWHVPTRTEFINLCGYSNKASGEDAPVTKEDAVLWDKTAGYGSVKQADALGWNHAFSGVRMKNNYSATPSYNKTAIAAANTSDASLVGLPALSYYASSTLCAANYSKTDTAELISLQFFGLMTTYTGAYKDGRLSVTFVHEESGVQLRCVKDAK